jgi:hypothetical protein
MSEHEPGSEHLKRRVFLGRMAVKAAYIAPAVLALKAAETTHAGLSACGQTGSPCTSDADCCVGFLCQNMGGIPCIGSTGMGSMGGMNCTCE